ncbi:MAG: AAA family ATPase [Bdellovibrionota bacterium]
MVRLSLFKRILNFDFNEGRALILFGPRKTGKTTVLHERFPNAIFFDLLKTDVRARFQLTPSRLREIVLENPKKTYILDEIQKVPTLLDEVHWLLENTEAHFILCGSSVRKLKRGAANLLGGRALRMDLFPLVFSEIPNFDLNRAINHGLIPQHYISKNPGRFIKAYIEQYLQEEIVEESRIRNLQVFHRFLEVAALMNGELLNYANVGSDCGVSPKAIREYYQILEDTLIGFTLNSWMKVKSRKLIETSKFYLFDTGLIRSLKGIDKIVEKTTEFGNLFETLMINEVRSYISYKYKEYKLSFWRTTSQLEVDLIVGPMLAAIEFKSTNRITRNELKGLNALLTEHSPEHKLLVCRVSEPLQLENGIRILPYEQFLKLLWSGKLF